MVVVGVVVLVVNNFMFVIITINDYHIPLAIFTMLSHKLIGTITTLTAIFIARSTIDTKRRVAAYRFRRKMTPLADIGDIVFIVNGVTAITIILIVHCHTFSAMIANVIFLAVGARSKGVRVVNDDGSSSIVLLSVAVVR